jgi:FixJ family two-component response regulator
MRVERTFVRSAPPSSPQKSDVMEPLVIIVDDDASVREALSELIRSAGRQATCFASTRELLASDVLDTPGCLILDVRMPGTSGLDLQIHLAENGNLKPIIFVTGHGDIPMTVQAMKAGAVDFLTKPVRDQTLLDAVSAGLAMDAAQRANALVVKRNVERLARLTRRERAVLCEIARGRLNKQIAFDLGISEVTVKLHRCNVMRKMEASTIGDLIRAWETLPAPMREADATATGQANDARTTSAQKQGLASLQIGALDP